MKFIRVPNQIIKYSCSVNHFILPAYLYSAVHCNPDNDNIVDTNIAHITETFAPNEDARRGMYLKFQKAINILSQGTNDSEITVNEITKKISGFSPCIKLKSIGEINKISRLEYVFLDRDLKMQNNFTMLYYDEYYFLLNTITSINKEKNKKEKLNLIDLLNFYCYLKMKIIYAKNVSDSKKQFSISMHDTINFMANTFGVGNKTISKYINNLIDLKMIHVRTANYKNKKSNEYTLSDSWRNNNE